MKDQWIYLGNIPSGATWQINQSYMMDRNVTNWAQTDNMTFNVVFYAQQSQVPHYRQPHHQNSRDTEDNPDCAGNFPA